METQRQRNRERQNDRETCRDRERETTKCKPDDIYNSEQFWLNTIMKDIVEPSRLRLAHASGARSGGGRPNLVRSGCSLDEAAGARLCGPALGRACMHIQQAECGGHRCQPGSMAMWQGPWQIKVVHLLVRPLPVDRGKPKPAVDSPHPGSG